MTNNSTPSTRPRKAGNSDRPPKPRKDFPLTPHPSGHWCKSIRGKMKYFGKWGKRVNGKMTRLPGDGWIEAEQLFEQQKADLFSGRTPRVEKDGLTIGRLCNRYLTGKQLLVDNGELTPRTFYDYRKICDRITEFFGTGRFVDDLGAGDFESLRAEIAKTNGPVRLGNVIQQIKMVFKFAYDYQLIDNPVRFGPNFKRPSKRVLRVHRNGNGQKMFEANELTKLLKSSNSQLRAMILLGINCGFGNSDCGRLPISALDLENGWINYPRPKTGIDRRCPLWKETVEAIKAVLSERKTPKRKEDHDLVFLTKRRERWTKDTIAANPISAEFRKLLQAEELYKRGRGFYALRHGFETIGGETTDQVAVDAIMGHVDASMAGTYRERISDERLSNVTNHIHTWLFITDLAS